MDYRLMVYDDFFVYPDKVREKALEQELGERVISRITDRNIARVIITNNMKDIRSTRRSG